MILIIGLLTYNSFQRNKVYESEISLWTSNVKKSPNKAESWGNLGAAWGRAGMIDKEISAYEKALELNPALGFIYYNLGVIYIQKEDFELAEKNFILSLQKGLKLHEQSGVFNNLGIVYYRLKRLDNAEAAWIKSLEIVENYQSHKNLGDFYFLTEDKKDRALLHYQKVIDQMPDHPERELILLRIEQLSGK